MKRVTFFSCIWLVLTACHENINNIEVKVVEKEKHADVKVSGVTQDQNRIGIWVEENNREDITKRLYYGYPSGSDTSKLQREVIYFKGNKIAEIDYKNNAIWNLTNYEEAINLNKQIIPVSTLGFSLFHTNCGSCHNYFPSNKHSSFRTAMDSLCKTDLDSCFRGKFDEHSKFNYLDVYEIEKICDYVLSEDAGGIRPQ